MYNDGSQGYEYEVGDHVIVESTIQGGWFDYGPTHSNMCIVERRVPFRRGDKPCRFTDTLEIRYSKDWGPADCKPRHVKPHADTLAKAKHVKVKEL